MRLPQTIIETAPCKVNLTLDVYPPRHDGFHDLDSVVATFTPADRLTVEIRQRVGKEPPIRLLCDDATLPTDERNLAFRAAQEFLAFLSRSGMPGREDATLLAVCLTLAKRLPHQAGLGGGSSDAAAVLRALARAFPVEAGDLASIAASIGSDVPLFLTGGGVFQRMQGRGERLAPLTCLMPAALHGVLVKPPAGVATGPAYAALDADRARVPGENTSRLLALLADGAPSFEAMGAIMGNDFEAVVLPLYPAIAQTHRAVTDAGAVRALLCGSGAAVFGLARGAEHAREMAQSLQSRYPFVEVAVQTAPNITSPGNTIVYAL